jgi:hypothetical protein
MSHEAILDQGAATESSIALPFPEAGWARVLYGLFVTALPVFSFWAIQPLKPEWQTGDLQSYITLLLFPEASLLFFPLLAYSILCYLLLLLAPTRYAGSFFIRLGVYTAVPLALYYSVAVLIYSLDSFVYVLLLVWIFPFAFSMIYRWVVTRWGVPRLSKNFFIFILGILIIASWVTKGSIPFLMLAALTMAAPFWSLLLAVQASIWLIKNYEKKITLSRGLGLTAWVAAYVAALRFDILKMYELYAALPPNPPADCYIATAAARGHPQFVHAWTVQRVDGKSMQVNEQLQWLKCAELALIAVNPRLHRFLRQMYDLIGKRLARKIQSPLLADAAYLFLKPWEWSAELILKVIIPEIDLISKKMYTN